MLNNVLIFYFWWVWLDVDYHWSCDNLLSNLFLFNRSTRLAGCKARWRHTDEGIGRSKRSLHLQRCSSETYVRTGPWSVASAAHHQSSRSRQTEGSETSGWRWPASCDLHPIITPAAAAVSQQQLLNAHVISNTVSKATASWKTHAVIFFAGITIDAACDCTAQLNLNFCNAPLHSLDANWYREWIRKKLCLEYVIYYSPLTVPTLTLFVIFILQYVDV